MRGLTFTKIQHVLSSSCSRKRRFWKQTIPNNATVTLEAEAELRFKHDLKKPKPRLGGRDTRWLQGCQERRGTEPRSGHAWMGYLLQKDSTYELHLTPPQNKVDPPQKNSDGHQIIYLNNQVCTYIPSMFPLPGRHGTRQWHPSRHMMD